jgi:hypothetical protein
LLPRLSRRAWQIVVLFIQKGMAYARVDSDPAALRSTAAANQVR